MSLRLATLNENSRDVAKWRIFTKTSGYSHDSKRQRHSSFGGGEIEIWTSLSAPASLSCWRYFPDSV
jgi:hypothetical protein